MQNKPNLCVFWAVSGDCEEKQTQSNPIYEMPKMNVSSVLTKDYENIHLHRSPKTNPIQTQSNPKQSQFQTRRTRLTDLQEGPAQAAYHHSCARFFLPTPPSLRTAYVYRKDYLDLLHRP